jgi:hypothetical protein
LASRCRPSAECRERFYIVERPSSNGQTRNDKEAGQADKQEADEKRQESRQEFGRSQRGQRGEEGGKEKDECSGGHLEAAAWIKAQGRLACAQVDHP